MKITYKSKPDLKKESINKYNSYLPPNRIVYKGRYIRSNNKNYQLSVDVRNFINHRDAYIKNIAKLIGAIKETSYDVKAILCQRFVCKMIKYAYDESNTGYTEYWQFPFETMTLKTGDCEDGAILMASLMLASGIPDRLVQVRAGWVKTGNPTAPTGGHAYVSYLRSCDWQPVILDWCYYPDPHIPISKKPLIGENNRYKDVWFAFNNKLSMGAKAFRFNKINDF